MFQVNDEIKNKHTGCIVKVTDVLHLKTAKNPVFCVEYVEDKDGCVDFRFNRNYIKHWEKVGDEEE